MSKIRLAKASLQMLGWEQATIKIVSTLWTYFLIRIRV